LLNAPAVESVHKAVSYTQYTSSSLSACAGWAKKTVPLQRFVTPVYDDVERH